MLSLQEGSPGWDQHASDRHIPAKNGLFCADSYNCSTAPKLSIETGNLGWKDDSSTRTIDIAAQVKARATQTRGTNIMSSVMIIALLQIVTACVMLLLHLPD